MDVTCSITLYNLTHSVTVPPAHSELHHRVCPDVPCAVRKQCVAEKQSSEQGKPHHIKTVFSKLCLKRGLRQINHVITDLDFLYGLHMLCWLFYYHLYR